MPEIRQAITAPAYVLTTDGILAGSNIGHSSLAQLASVLPNNLRINGIEHFYQTTKPATRGDSSALVVGDYWYTNNDQTEWRWNGTYWLSAEQYSLAVHSGSNNYGGNNGLFVSPASHSREFHVPVNSLLTSYRVNWSTANTHNGSNFYRVTTALHSSNFAVSHFNTEIFRTDTATNGTVLFTAFIVNTLIANTQSNVLITTTNAVTGSPTGNLFVASTLFYRLIAP